MSLLGNIDKKPYQAYTIEHGIERIQVKIPLKEASAFEAAFAAALCADISKTRLMAIVEEHGGSVRTQKRSA